MLLGLKDVVCIIFCVKSVNEHLLNECDHRNKGESRVTCFVTSVCTGIFGVWSFMLDVATSTGCACHFAKRCANRFANRCADVSAMFFWD